MKVYTVTVVDVVGDPVLGIRRTPAVFTDLNQAVTTVRNNDEDLSDDNLYQYAVIEETELNVIRPDLCSGIKQWWFKYNTALDEFVPCEISAVPTPISKLKGFGIG